MSNLAPLTNLDQARMRALRNGIYHSMRRSFYERWERILNFVVVGLGTATATAFAKDYLGEHAVAILGVATAGVGAFQLVWGLGLRARDHAVLQGKFYALVSRAENVSGDPDATAREIERELAQLYGEETQTMYAVNALAYNAAQRANGRSVQLAVNFLERITANWIAYSPDHFKPTKVIEPPAGNASQTA